MYCRGENRINLQGRVRFPTGGKAHEPQGMIRCNSGADSTVWMEEDGGTKSGYGARRRAVFCVREIGLWMIERTSGAFFFGGDVCAPLKKPGFPGRSIFHIRHSDRVLRLRGALFFVSAGKKSPGKIHGKGRGKSVGKAGKIQEESPEKNRRETPGEKGKRGGKNG